MRALKPCSPNGNCAGTPKKRIQYDAGTLPIKDNPLVSTADLLTDKRGVKFIEKKEQSEEKEAELQEKRDIRERRMLRVRQKDYGKVTDKEVNKIHRLSSVKSKTS